MAPAPRRDGTQLEWATYLSGSGENNLVWKLKIDRASFAYVCGATNSPDFPLVNAADASPSGSEDPFVTEFNPTGGGILYSSWLSGGVATELGEDIEASGDTLAIAGWTASGLRGAPAWHYAIEDGRGVAQMSGTGPFWAVSPGYDND